ncbi:hypothetical protein LCGC14_2939170 [marine sediment metagenome]|uniref:Uncharacterized protein n=1 Tax=marine sediment metagenome TaxID=412755 RepID=A0A0F8Y5M1_9ZZZZ
MYLLMNIPKTEAEDEGCINIDEFKSKYSTNLERNSKSHIISPETEFWGHCSNIQAWVETNYNPNVLHSSISLPLLTELALCDRKIFDSLLYHLDEMWKAYHTKERRIFVHDKYAEIIIRGVDVFNIDIKKIDSTFINVIRTVDVFNKLGKTFRHIRKVIKTKVYKILVKEKQI